MPLLDSSQEEMRRVYQADYQSRYDANIAAGMSPEQAAAQARADTPADRRGGSNVFTDVVDSLSGRGAEREAQTERAAGDAQEAGLAHLQQSAPDLDWQNVEQERWGAAQESGDFALGESAGSGVQADPEAIAAERAALQQLQQMASSGGFTAGDRARIREGQRSAGAYAASQRGAIENQARARGMGGSGVELASLLGASQGAANMSAASTDAATRAGEDRAFDALQMSGDLGGRMRGESFDEGAYRADATDARDVYNNEYLRQRASRNADREQQARQSNAGTANEMGMENAVRRRGYQQQEFENTSGIEDRRAGRNARAEENARAAGQQSKQFGAQLIGGAIGGVGGIVARAAASRDDDDKDD